MKKKKNFECDLSQIAELIWKWIKNVKIATIKQWNSKQGNNETKLLKNKWKKLNKNRKKKFF